MNATMTTSYLCGVHDSIIIQNQEAIQFVILLDFLPDGWRGKSTSPFSYM